MSKLKIPNSLFLSLHSDQTVKDLLFCTNRKGPESIREQFQQQIAEEIPVTSKRKLEPATGLVIIFVKFCNTSYQVYYKNKCYLREFMNYFSNLKREQFTEVNIVVNQKTKEILSLEVELDFTEDKELHIELVEARKFVNIKWKSVTEAKFQTLDVDHTYFWVKSLKTVSEYTDLLKSTGTFMSILKQSSWYLRNEFIFKLDRRRMQIDFHLLFPDFIEKQLADMLLGNQMCGYKIFTNFGYFLQTIGLQIKSIEDRTLHKKDKSLFEEVMQRPDLNERFQMVLGFLNSTGFHRFAMALIGKIQKFIDVKNQKQVAATENQFLLIYDREKDKDLFIDLIHEVYTKPFRVYEFLKQKRVYEFRECSNCFNECLLDFKLHTFEEYQKWFFPILPEITIEQFTKIKSNKTVGENILKAYTQYLEIFDLKFDEDKTVIKRQNSLSKFKHPLNKVAYVDRIIVSLSTVGFRPYAKKLVTFLKQINMDQIQLIRRHQQDEDCEVVYGCTLKFLKTNHKLIVLETDICVCF